MTRAAVRSTLILAACLSLPATTAAFVACGSEDDASPGSDAAAPDAKLVPDAAPVDAAPSEPWCLVDATAGSGQVDQQESYWGRCSPTCGEGQFCFSLGASPLEFGPDAADDRPATGNWPHARPLYCDGCHPMPACDGADPCACLLATLPADVCDGTPVQCRVLDSGPQFRCRAFPFE